MACLLGSFSIDESLERKNIRGLGWDFFYFFVKSIYCSTGGWSSLSCILSFETPG